MLTGGAGCGTASKNGAAHPPALESVHAPASQPEGATSTRDGDFEVTLRRLSLHGERAFDSAPVPYADNPTGFVLSFTLTVWDRSKRQLFRVPTPPILTSVTNEAGEQLIVGDQTVGTFRPWEANPSSPREFIAPTSVRWPRQRSGIGSSDSFDLRLQVHRPPLRLERFEGAVTVEVATEEMEVMLSAAPSEELKSVAPGLHARVLTTAPRQEHMRNFYNFEFVVDQPQGAGSRQAPTLGSIEVLDEVGQVIGRAGARGEETVGNRTRTVCELEMVYPPPTTKPAKFRLRVVTATRLIELPIRWGPIDVADIAIPPNPIKE